MKRIIMLGISMIFLLAIVACSANNTTENEAKVTPIVAENEHNVEHETDAVETEPSVAEPVVDVEAEVDTPVVPEVAEVAEPAIVEPKDPPATAKPEEVVPKEEPAVVEPEKPAVVEPAPAAAEPKTHKVDIVNFAFSPGTLEISVGDIVEFTNLDRPKHSAVEDNGVFDTGLLGQNESKKITFTEAGEFGYYCGPHPDMRAMITVK